MGTLLFAMGLAGWSAIAQPSPAPRSRPVIAVFTLKSEGTSFKPSEIESVSEYVSTQLAASGRFQVVPRDEVKKAIVGQKKASYEACYDESCQIEVGKELAAEKVVVGSISKFGAVCLVNLRIFDLAKSAAAMAGTARGACAAEAVLASVDEAVERLIGGPKSASAKRGVDAPVAVTPSPKASKPTTKAAQPVDAPKKVVVFDEVDAPQTSDASERSQQAAARPIPPTPSPVSARVVFARDDARRPAPPKGRLTLKETKAQMRAGSTTAKHKFYVRKIMRYSKNDCANETEVARLQRKAANTCQRKPNGRLCATQSLRITRALKRIERSKENRKRTLRRAKRFDAQFAQGLEHLGRMADCYCGFDASMYRDCNLQ
ncbi:MAG: DUF2380 domain-containing protein [Myxococcota bacterium]